MESCGLNNFPDEEMIDQHEDNIRRNIIQERNEFRDRHQCFCETRNGSSSAIAFPPSKSYECSHRMTPDSEVTRFLERRYEQATWKMHHRMCKAKAERGSINQRLEKSTSLNFKKNGVEQNINHNMHSLLDMEVFSIDY